MHITTERPKLLRRPRLGFLGVGWIGRNRMETIARSGIAEIAAIAEPSAERAEEAVCALQKIGIQAPSLSPTLQEMLGQELDGVVIATPSALHAEQSIACLQNGVSVFCQKPLARNGEEAREVVDAARANNCLLGVDLSYRHLEGMKQIRDLVQGGALGKIFAVELFFHNAYGPDKAWFYNPRLSGGGCVIDLGIHLVDLALWALDFPEVDDVASQLFKNGHPVWDDVEDYATAQLKLSSDVAVQLSCSWKLPVGCDALISVGFYGTKGGGVLKNVNGSFYEFTAEHCQGTKHTVLSRSNGDWHGGAALEWTRQLAAKPTFDSQIEHVVEVAQVLDRIYKREGSAVCA
jgi:predicted dehydrogenase